VIRVTGGVNVPVPTRPAHRSHISKTFLQMQADTSIFRFTGELKNSWRDFGLRHIATRVLVQVHELSRTRKILAPYDAKMRFGALFEIALLVFYRYAAHGPALLHTLLSIYGWHVSIGALADRVDPHSLTNVFIRCGQAHHAKQLGRKACKWMEAFQIHTGVRLRHPEFYTRTGAILERF